MVSGKAEQESTPFKKDENDQSIDVQEDMTGLTKGVIFSRFSVKMGDGFYLNVFNKSKCS